MFKNSVFIWHSKSSKDTHSYEIHWLKTYFHFCRNRILPQLLLTVPLKSKLPHRVSRLARTNEVYFGINYMYKYFACERMINSSRRGCCASWSSRWCSVKRCQLGICQDVNKLPRIIIALVIVFYRVEFACYVRASELKLILLRKTITVVGTRKLKCYRTRVVKV